MDNNSYTPCYTIEKDDDKYESDFTIIKQLEQGGFGKVSKVEDKCGQYYALKEIMITRTYNLETITKEVELNQRLISDFTVEFIRAWTNTSFVFIQMELCCGNLKEIIEKKPGSFGRKKSERINSLEYFISCQLVKEVAECLDYLHSSTPPIIHRDLKPSNILFTNGKNGRFIKLCDFGLSKEYLRTTNTQGIGTLKYMASEVKKTDHLNLAHYTLGADIFSLAIIALELFGFSLVNITQFIKGDKLLEPYNNSNLVIYFKNLFETLRPCILKDTNYHDRPKCKEFMNKMDTWIIGRDLVLNDQEFESDKKSLDNSNNEFFINYSSAKLFNK